jgi:hydroxymethylbilane synthase
MRAVLATLDHPGTRTAVTAERALLAALEGGCQVPIGAAMLSHESGFTLHGVIASLDGTHVVRGSIGVDPTDPVAAGQLLAKQLYAEGGVTILAALRASS